MSQEREKEINENQTIVRKYRHTSAVGELSLHFPTRFTDRWDMGFYPSQRSRQSYFGRGFWECGDGWCSYCNNTETSRLETVPVKKNPPTTHRDANITIQH